MCVTAFLGCLRGELTLAATLLYIRRGLGVWGGGWREGGWWNGLFSLLGRGPLNGSLVERWEDGASDSRKSFADVTPGNRVSGEQR